MSRRILEQVAQKIWYADSGGGAIAAKLLAPLSCLYGRVAASKRQRAIDKLADTEGCDCAAIVQLEKRPIVIVVGNITVGGTGKTPMLAALANVLVGKKYTVGIVCRGYGGARDVRGAEPVRVPNGALARQFGDEAVLLTTLTRCPVFVGRDRAKAVSALVAQAACDIVLSDDGLQHYAMRRSIELVLIDSRRGLGNGRLLPAGPLREPVSRLAEADALLYNDTALPKNQHPPSKLMPRVPAFRFILQPVALSRLHGERQDDGLDAHSPQSLVVPEGLRKVHAVSGIGNPQRFFSSVRALGLDIVEHVFADHHSFTVADLQFGDTLPIVMTAKDAVKCVDLHGLRDLEVYVLKVEAIVDNAFIEFLLRRIETVVSKRARLEGSSAPGSSSST
mgnify:CR=1 FL=1